MYEEQGAGEVVATRAPGSRTLAIQCAPEELTTSEAAAVLGCSPRVIRRAVASGELPAVKRGSSYRIPRAALQHYAETLASSPPQRPLASLVAFPAAPSSSPLPEPLSSFIGRRTDLATVTTLLDDPAMRLVTLTGPGGIGKTRLALAAVSAIDRDRFPDGVVFVALADVTGPGQVIPAIAQALGLRERPGQRTAEQLRRFLADKHLLLVLDNFEHLLAAGAEVAALLTGAPGVMALVTSRAPLRVMGERELPVLPMSLAGSQTTPDELLTSDAGRLFVERAQEHDPSFLLDEESAPLIADICARLDGLPLAIELAAARVKVLPPPQLHARLTHRLPLLTRGARDAPARHSTMRDAIAWSYELLTPDEQQLFLRLAVFEGGCTLEAAAAVSNAGRDDADETIPGAVIDSLANLIEQSLLIVEEGADDGPRFRQLETVREFGLERLAQAGDEDDVRARHAGYFLTLVRKLQPIVATHGRQSVLDQLAAEHANLQAALLWLERRGPESDFVGLVSALAEYWFTECLLREGQSWLERALTSLDSASIPEQVRLLDCYTTLLICQGQFMQAEPFLARALLIGRDGCDPIDRGWTLIAHGAWLNSGGRYAEAEQPLREALALSGQIGDPVLQAAVAGRALSNLSVAARGQDDIARAAAYSEEALRRYDGQQLDRAASVSLMDLGAITYAAGDYDLAVTRWLEGIELTGGGGDLRQVADALSGIACVAAARGQPRAAMLLFGAADAVRERVGTAILWASDIAAVEGSLATLRGKLSEQTVAETLTEGQALSLAEAIALAATVARPTEALPNATDPTNRVLTRRERDVLRLLAAQKTDREIAEALFLSLRTVNWHVRSILAKLGSTSRREAIIQARAFELV